MRRAPTRSDCLGASPRRVLHTDPLRLDLSRSLSEQQYLHDMQAIRQMFASGELGGYWEPPPETCFEDSAGTVPASVNGVVGALTNRISGQPAAVQSTTANKPYLRRTPTTNRYWLDGNTSTANLTATFPSSLGSACAIAKLDPELGVQWSENQTIGTTYNLITPYAYHGPTLVINRALTAAEKAIVARVMNRFMPTTGPQLIPNWDFSTDGFVGWNNTSTGAGSAAISGGIATVTGVDVSNRGKVASTFYGINRPGVQVSFRFKLLTGTVSAQAVLSAGGVTIDLFGALANIEYACSIQAGTGVMSGSPGFNVYGAGTRTLDYVSLKEIL